MARTTAQDVKEALLRQYDSVNEPSLTGFIRRANLLTTRVASGALALGVTLSSGELSEIECLLAAHFYQAADPAFREEWNEKAKGVYHDQAQHGMFLTRTNYGQDAMLLDHSGYLASVSAGARRRGGVAWLGKTPSQQVDYEDR